MSMNEKAKVFFDTTVLLKSFLYFRSLEFGETLFKDIPLHLHFVLQLHDDESLKTLPSYLRDNDTQLFTFEKCIYEAYLAFRGVGGKKPDEGRGDWANRHLRLPTDPKPLAKLATEFHGQNNDYAFFWVNQIEEFYGSGRMGIHGEEIQKLLQQKYYFEDLCDDFHRMLKFFNFTVLYYMEVFGNDTDERFISAHVPSMLDSFNRMTAIPSEDFEIVYAAERIGADIFITDDKRLISCSKSLGSGSYLGPSAFCRSDDYQSKKKQWQNGTMSAVMASNYKLTKRAIGNLRKAGMPDVVVEKLKDIENKKFTNFEEFLTALRSHIGGDELPEYEEKILDYAKL